MGFGAGTGGSLGIGIDNNGNIGLVTGASGGATMPTLSLTGFVSASNASNLKVLEGNSAIVGASGGEGAVFGGEINIMPDPNKERLSFAGSLQLGVGFGIPFEMHGEYAKGYVFSFNIYDLLISGCDFLLK